MSPEANPQQANARCAECGAPFRCGIDDAGACWCARDFPATLPLPADNAGCLCRDCLRRRLAAREVAR